MSNVVTRGKKVQLNPGDIQIGAVELKDHDSDTRVDVELDITKNAVYVQSESLAQESTLQNILEALGGETGNNINTYGEVSVVPATETTIVSYTVATGKKFVIKGVSGSGLVDGLFILYVNTTKQWSARNAWTERNVGTNTSFIANAGDVIALKVTNQTLLTRTFTGNIWGLEITP